MKTSNGILSQLQTENEHFRSRIDDFRAANAACEQNLRAERTANNYTKQILIEERRGDFDTLQLVYLDEIGIPTAREFFVVSLVIFHQAVLLNPGIC